MSYLDFTRGTTGIRLLLEFGVERGVQRQHLLQGSHLSAEQITDPNVEVSALQELRVTENLLRALRSPPGLGLEVGLRYQLSNFGLWGFGLMSSATFGAALDLSLRFLPLTYAYSTITAQKTDDKVVLRFGEPELPPVVGRFLIERDMAAAAALQRQLGGEQFELLTFELKAGRGRAHAPSATVGTICKVAPDYAAPGYALSFHRRYLAQRLPNADPATVLLCEQMCNQLIERRRARFGMARTIEHFMRSAPESVTPTLDAFARLSNASTRTVKRRLQQEGTSFRAIVARTRSEYAAQLVRDRSVSLTTIAERLGYADVSSFSQAFKRWFGVSPMAYRSGRAVRSSTGPVAAGR